MRSIVFGIPVLTLVTFGFLSTAAAQSSVPSGPPSSPTWHWPLYEAAAPSDPDDCVFGKDHDGNISTAYCFVMDGDRILTSTPRPAVWNSHGSYEEYDHFGDDDVSFLDAKDPDVHPGIDIRGDAGDVVEVPLEGEVFWVQNIKDDCRVPLGLDKCRVFIRSNDGKYAYYLAHFTFGAAPDGPMRKDWQLVVKETDYGYAAAGGSALKVKRGQQIGVLRDYSAPQHWTHLHISLFDREEHYDNLNLLSFLPRDAQGGDGASLAIVDDERPFVDEPELVRDATPGTRPKFLRTLSCGDRLTGKVDVVAHMTDTFYTSRPAPSPFPGSEPKSGWHPTMGVYGARYVVTSLATGEAVADDVWYESPLACVAEECGAWRLPFAAAGRPTSRDDAQFMQYLGKGNPPVNIGDDVAYRLWEPFGSHQDLETLYSNGVTDSTRDDVWPHSPFQFLHFLTNDVAEDSPLDGNAAWDTSKLDDGAYVVTVEAWDLAGNKNQSSRVVHLGNSGAAVSSTSSAWAPVYSRDHDDDLGQVPSNLGGQPHWGSPDILIRPVISGSTAPAANHSNLSSVPVQVGKAYEIWVRVHNPGCADAPGVKARVWSARPGTGITDLKLRGEAQGSGAVPAGESLWVGPFAWTPTKDDLDGLDKGHRCLLAQVASDLEPFPQADARDVTPSDLDVTGDDNVVQRNLQTAELRFFVQNGYQGWRYSRLIVELDGLQDGETVSLLLERDAELDKAWGPECSKLGSTPPVQCEQLDDWYRVTFESDKWQSPGWWMPAVSELQAVVESDLGEGNQGTLTLTQRLGGAIEGGMVVKVYGPRSVK